jgi:hypothetical protein
LSAETKREAGQAEVHDQRLAEFIEHDVARFEIAVDHAGFMRGPQPSDYLASDSEGLGQRQLAPARNCWVLSRLCYSLAPMPISGVLDSERKVFRTEVSGVVTIPELSEHLVAARRAEAYRHPGLVDARGVHTIDFTNRDLMKLAHELKRMIAATGPAPRAVVVDGLVHFGMARLFASLVAGWLRVGVFDDEEEALRWLTAQTPES